MGLAGNKQKQRIQDDPRNTRWATDTSAPGFRLLSSMGWTPSAPALGNASSQDLISAGGSTAYNKKISVIPTAKSDNLGIGARGGQGIGSMRAIGVPMGAMGFMAASTPGEGVHEVKEVKTGGEFGRLLERLNAASAAASAASSAAGSEAEEDKEEGKKEKKSKKDKDGKKRKRSAEDDEDSAPATPIAVDSPGTPLSPPTASGSASPVPTAILHNPRNAARSKHLRAKRLATANNAAAMAEILGIAPPSSSAPARPLHSPVPSSSITSIPFQTKVQVSSPSEEGWPVAPARKFPVFASSGTGGLAATWGGEVTQVTVVEEVVAMELDPVEVEKERKRAKKERKESKKLKKEGGTASEVEEVVEVPVVAARKFPMFASASTTGLAATFVVEEVKEVTVVEVQVGEVDEAERKAAKKARKEEKRAKKAAAAAET